MWEQPNAASLQNDHYGTHLLLMPRQNYIGGLLRQRRITNLFLFVSYETDAALALLLIKEYLILTYDGMGIYV